MNIEELKLILGTIRTLSGDASIAAYWYFGLEFAKFVLGWLVGAGVVLALARMIAKANGADEDFMCECRDALGIGCCGSLSQEERRDTQATIRKLIHVAQRHMKEKNEKAV